MKRDLFRQFAVIFTTSTPGFQRGGQRLSRSTGHNTGQISDSFNVLFVPAGYVFSIWGIIYIGLLAFTIFHSLPAQRSNPRLRRIGWLAVLSSIANGTWIFFWHSAIMRSPWSLWSSAGNVDRYLPAAGHRARLGQHCRALVRERPVQPLPGLDHGRHHRQRDRCASSIITGTVLDQSPGLDGLLLAVGVILAGLNDLHPPRCGLPAGTGVGICGHIPCAFEHAGLERGRFCSRNPGADNTYCQPAARRAQQLAANDSLKKRSESMCCFVPARRAQTTHFVLSRFFFGSQKENQDGDPPEPLP